MKTFVVDSNNNIRAGTSNDRTKDGPEKFANEGELAALAKSWAASRFVEIWNNLPGVKPLRRFRDRDTAVRRIWEQAQKLHPPTTKADLIIDLLKQPSGATIEALMALTGWQPHSVRGFISAQLAKRMGFQIKSFKRDGQHVYQIASKATARRAQRKEKP
jgi:hypothetical protein